MSKFNIGDKVRVVNPHSNIWSNYLGHILTINDINPNPSGCTSRFRYSVDENEFYWHEHELELVERNNNMFTKKDLKNGDVVKFRNGWVEIVCCDTGTLIAANGYNDLDEYNDDLTYRPKIISKGRPYDIVAVRRPREASDCTFRAFDRNDGDLVYERKEVEEMTLEEVCKALGKDIKIVKEK